MFLVKIDEYIGFCVDRRSCLLGSPVIAGWRGSKVPLIARDLRGLSQREANRRQHVRFHTGRNGWKTSLFTAGPNAQRRSFVDEQLQSKGKSQWRKKKSSCLAKAKNNTGEASMLPRIYRLFVYVEHSIAELN